MSGPTGPGEARRACNFSFTQVKTLSSNADSASRIGARAKRSKLVHVGDQIRIRKGPYEYQVTLRVAAERRGSAKDAALFYEESDESRVAREQLQEQHRLVARTFQTTKGRPTKKERRDIDRLKGRD